MALVLSNVRTDFDGFRQLIMLHDEIASCREEERIEIDMSRVSWLEANMCAPLGAVLYASGKTHGMRLLDMGSRVMSILQKNGFLPNFGFDRPKKLDRYGTTIEYQRFETSDGQAFKEYVAKRFVNKPLPQMSAGLHSKFRRSISELFQNAVDHSNTTQGIFACGQFFPGRTNRRLDFSVADLGDGMRKVILENAGVHLPAEAAINWAMQGDNTTRRPDGGKPGGLGLKLIREFINLNGGRLQIVSDTGYWNCQHDQVTVRRFDSPFPGTVVNIEINTGDKQSYRLVSEIDPKDIF